MSQEIQNPYGAPVSMGNEPTPQYGRGRLLTLKSIDVLSAGKVLGIGGVLFGLLAALFFVSLTVLGGMSVSGQQIGGALLGGLITGIMLPLIYGVAGFVGGVVYALIYNLCARTIGGLKFELEG